MDMTAAFTGTPKHPGIRGDHARVTRIEGRVLIRAIDAMADEAAVTIAMRPDPARALASGIIDSSEKAEAHQ